MDQPTGTPSPEDIPSALTEIPEFRDVQQRPDGTWTAVHTATGDVITAPTFEHLERVEAPRVRLLNAWHAAWGRPAERQLGTGGPS